MGTQNINSIDTAVDYVLDVIQGDIVLGIPLGIGKPNPFVNVLYRRIKANPARRMKIITALSLSKPEGHSDIERHFLAPFVERVFGDYPDLEYAVDQQKGTLPPNIEVLEFFLKTGDYLDNAEAQQNHISTNYTFAARDMALHGVNVLAQAIAVREDLTGRTFSLSGNPELTAEALEYLRKIPDHQFVTIGVINRKLPFMPNGAEIADDFFDVLVDDPKGTHTIFAPPNMKINLTDYAIAMHASSLVKDGGTLQIGIGSLGDAIAQTLLVREQHAEDYRRILGSLGVNVEERETGRFDQGLYGCSEMFVNGILKLIEAGIIRREVFSDYILQGLLNRGEISLQVDADTINALLRVGRIHSPLTAEDVAFLQKFGILRQEAKLDGTDILIEGKRISAVIDREDALEALAREALGARLTGGIVMHGGFFLGPGDFYQHLRDMPPEKLARIDMNRIDFINQVYGHSRLIQEQRRDARFINTTMMVTLLGAAVSDGLDNGQVVSGVGGQYNFVAMGHALPDARSILLLRATRQHQGQTRSNIVWNYGHTTIPRHLRDIVITEYGVADLRGQVDAEVVKRLIAIADSRFQPELVAAAKINGKLAQDWHVPESQRNNLPEHLSELLQPWRSAAILPDFPFGTDFTPDEIAIMSVLQKFKHASEHPLELVRLALKGLFGDRPAPAGWLQRLGLDEVHGLRQLMMRRLFLGNL